MSGSAELLPSPSARNDSETNWMEIAYGWIGIAVILIITALILTAYCACKHRKSCIRSLRLCPAYVIFCCTGAYRRRLNWRFRLPSRRTRDAVVPRPQPAPAPARDPVVPPQPAPVPVPAGRAPQPPAQNIPLVPLQGGDRSSSDQPPPQQVIIAADAHGKPQPPNGDSPRDEHQPHDATVGDSQQPPDSPHEQQPLLASRDSHQPLEACEDSDDEQKPLLAARDEQQSPTADSSYEQQSLLAAADMSDESRPAAAGDKQLRLPIDQLSDKEKPSSKDARRHKLSLPSLITQQKPCSTRRAKTSTELGVDEERKILLEDQDCPEEQPVSDQLVLTSDDDGRHMRRQYGTSSLHSAPSPGPVSKSSSSDEDKEEDTAL